MLTKRPKRTPDRWGAENRIYPPYTGRPGPRDPTLTPYTIDWMRTVGSGLAKVAVLVTFAQSGKTDAILDVLGSRLDQRPAPILYVGPSKEFLTDQFEPRLMELFDQARSLGRKVARGKRNKKTLKWVAGVRLRLAHGGSSTALKSDPAALALIDEYEEMLANVKGQGDPLGLVRARGDTYADFSLGVVSTPSRGAVDVERDPASGLEFWKRSPSEDLESNVWRLYQEGTMHHWAWPCPHCRVYFVPRFRNLRWPDGASPARAHREAHVECPNCAGKIENRHKEAMNGRGRFVAPGQRVDTGGVVHGSPRETSIFSYWVSGLCSPFQTFGDRAEAFVEATAENDPEKIQTVYNAGFGELYAPGGGSVPEWREVFACKAGYARPEVGGDPSTIPSGVKAITAAVDVQQSRLIIGVRGWGARATSWLLDDEEIEGDTTDVETWDELSDLLQARWGGLPIKVAFVDSGFRPGDPKLIPANRVYTFCRQHQRFVFPTKGADLLKGPMLKSQIEVTQQGAAAKFGLTLWRLNTDWWKQWVFERIRWPRINPETGEVRDGGWFVHDDISEAYARQIVSEARLVTPAGRAQWVRKSRDNHYLDVEAMNAAAGYLLGVHRMGVRSRVEDPPELDPPQPPAAPSAPPPPTAQDISSRMAKWAGGFNSDR